MTLYNTRTKQEFEDKVLNSKKTVLVDFWADWCPPCRAMAPILHDLGDELDANIDIVKVDIEDGPENSALAVEYQISSIPNMHIFKGGKVVDHVIGMVPKLHLVEVLNQAAK